MRRMLIFLMLALLPVLAHSAADQRGLVARPKAPTGEVVKGDLWLLTIGINSYLSWPRLKTAANDARGVKEVLLQRYYLDKSHVIELIDDKATRHNILASFRDLAKRVKPEDSLMVYYAGHGHIDPITGKGSWIPVESGADDPTAWISNRDITDYLNINAIKARHVLMVSDSCFSGDFFRGSRGALPAIDDAFLKKAYSRSSRQAISSGGLEPVSDAGFGGNSVFSHFLVAALKNNGKDYLIPSEIFGEIKAGVGRNADQLPQFGDLHGVGGQDGGELIFFLRQKDKLGDLSADSAARLKELEQLKRMDQEAAVAKQKEQAEIAKREAELAALDKQIADMKGRLGSGDTKSGDSLDSMLAMVDQKEEQERRLEELRQQREAEEQKRRQEIARLKKEAVAQKTGKIKSDLAKYQKIAASKYGRDMAGSAWDALVATYPDARGVSRGDSEAFLLAVLNPPDTKDPTTDMGFVAVPGGCFQMENHEACVGDFSIGKFEVTQGQWQTVMGNNPSHFYQCGPDCPVEQVSWDDAQRFIDKLNSRSGKRYRLPTEAEWEYACRSGGKNEQFCGGNDVDTVAWHENNSDKTTHRVGAKQANGLGIHDMSGNVWEWVGDWYGNYPTGQVHDYTGPSSGTARVQRGGSWSSGPVYVRASSRDWVGPSGQGIYFGFRLVSSQN